MTKQPIDFDAGDSLADFAGTGPSQGPRALPTDAGLTRIRDQGIGQAPSATPPTFKVLCQKCGGSGRFRSYSGRDAGPCFTCEGRGHFERKTAPTVLAKRREQAGARKIRTWEGFEQREPAIAAWIAAKASTFDFAKDMLGHASRDGDLSDGRKAAINKMIARDAERQAARQADRTSQATRSVDLSATKVAAAFAAARDKGLKRLSLRFDGLRIKQSQKHAETLYVTDGKRGEDATYYGKIVGDIFAPVRTCPDQIRTRILEIAKDPAAAAKVYGIETGTCCCCGAELTDPESKANGIGPICAGNYGF